MKKNHEYKGFFITFEGPEGSGKSTQSQRLGDYLKKKGHDVIMTFEPGGTPIANQIRSVILSRENVKMTPYCEMFLYAASRAQHVSEIIIPHLEKGGIVICDRFADSSLAYQAFARRIGYETVSLIQKYATCGVTPDLTIMLDILTEIGLERTFKKRNPNKIEKAADRLELEDIEFHREVRAGYLRLAEKDSARIKVLNAEEAPEEIFAKTITLVENALNEKMQFNHTA